MKNPKPWRCSLCGHTFQKEEGGRKHIASYHKRRYREAQLEAVPPEDFEPSLAEEVLDIQERIACGEPVESWEREMVP